MFGKSDKQLAQELLERITRLETRIVQLMLYLRMDLNTRYGDDDIK
jgi:hypothetical protein